MTCDCGHEAEPDGVGTGYGKDSTGRTLCYPCCLVGDLTAIDEAEPGAKVVYYVDSAGRFITNWPGGVLMRQVRFSRRHPWSRERHYLTAIDRKDRTWSGIGAPGMYATLRLTKRAW